MSNSEKIDSRFIYPQPPKWKAGHTQKLQGSELITILPTTKSQTLYQFELSDMNSVLLFGPNSGFRVKCLLQAKATAAAADSTYAAIPAEDYTKVQLIPNWFEHIVKSVEIFNGNTQVKCNDVNLYADTWLNTYLYSMMDKETKRNLFPEANNPARCVPSVEGGFPATADSEWHKYSKQVFGKSSCEFRYVPTNVFPFFQQPEFGANGTRLPAALPMSALEKVTISLNLVEDYNIIFKKIGTEEEKAANTKVYRLVITAIELLVEEARLNSTFEKSVMRATKPLLYPGVTRYGMVESIPPGLLTHRTELPKLDFPEGIFIFALSNKVAGGAYNYSTDRTDLTRPIFMPHNITNVDLTFNGVPFFVKSPNAGHLRDNFVAIRNMIEHLENPPFGIPQDPDLVTFETIKDGGKDTNYPHAYIYMCPSRNETRLIPIMEDGKIINNPGEFYVNLKFGTGGATANATYFIYVFYSDVCMVLDTRNKTLLPFYKKVRSAY